MADPRASVEQHLARILAGVAVLPPLEVDLAEASGRVLSADVTAALAVPGFDHAAMDGFAVRAAEVASATEHAPVRLPVVGVVAAGDPVPPLPAGSALRIMTGAPVPPGADLVVPFEWTDRADPVLIRRAAPAGRHIRRRGEDVREADVALRAGTRLGPTQLGLLAAVGRRAVPVQARPRVAILATGAELQGPGQGARAPVAGGTAPGAVPDSNTVTLAAAARRLGAEASAVGPVADDPTLFRTVLEQAAAAADLVITTGGISAGDHDVVKAALRDVEGFWFGSVAMKPGRPQGFGTIVTADGRRVPVVTLPGTPVAAYCSFLLFCVDPIHALAGRALPAARLAELGAPVRATDRTVLLPATYDEDDRVVPLPGHAGHSQRLLAASDVLLVVPAADRVIDAGEILQVHVLDPEGD